MSNITLINATKQAGIEWIATYEICIQKNCQRRFEEDEELKIYMPSPEVTEEAWQQAWIHILSRFGSFAANHDIEISRYVDEQKFLIYPNVRN